MSRVYLDYNATAPLRDEARAAMIAAMDVTGNPSSVHAEGRAAKALVERARAQVADALGCAAREVVFTSGATEASSLLRRWSGPVSVDGRAHDALWAHDRAGEGQTLHAYGLANSETGEICKADASEGARVLCDLTQAVGRIPVAFNWMGADFGVVSAHKCGGPKGVGALIVRDGTDVDALLLGGGQEMGRRAGTENVIGIAGFGAAISAANAELEAGRWDAVATLRDEMEAAIVSAVPEAVIVAADNERLPNTSCIIVPGWKGETQVMQMDLAGFAISAGSACSSGKVKPSRVLQVMGYNEADAASAIRVSIGPETTRDELMDFVSAWSAAFQRHRARAA